MPFLGCGRIDLFYSDGAPFYRVACGFACCINPPSAGSDESEKWQNIQAARQAYEEAHPNGTPTPSELAAMSPSPVKDSARWFELGKGTPPGGWEAWRQGRKQDKLLQSGEPDNVIDLRSPPSGKGKGKPGRRSGAAGKRPRSPERKPDFGDDSD